MEERLQRTLLWILGIFLPLQQYVTKVDNLLCSDLSDAGRC
jgi:hypothetical protein